MATIIYRYMKAKGIDMTIDEETDFASYEDFEKVSKEIYERT